MIVALRHMVEQLPSGDVVKLMPGDEVKTFASWPYQNKCAALSMRMVRKVEGVAPDANALLALPPDPDAKAEIDAEHGWNQRPRVALLPPDLRIEAAHVSAPAPAPTPAREGEDETQASADELLMAEDPELAKALGLEKTPCDACDFQATNAAGLKIHKARQHKVG